MSRRSSTLLVAYVPQRDLFIEKDSSINEHIEQMRLSATKSLMERRDVVIVATVSAIYGIGDPSEYHGMILHLRQGEKVSQREVIARTGRPALVLAPNKTLAAQLYSEFREFFPNNAVEYFVSYYDYYQPEAIAKIVEGIGDGLAFQTLLGVTGSGKTFTMANVIAQLGRPALVLAPNKTLAAQLYSEFREFFPENAVEYFVSYYDYYQPEAYVPSRDLYIEKDSSINEHIEQMRLSATKSVLERRDTVIVASVRDRKSTRLNSSHPVSSRMPSSA